MSPRLHVRLAYDHNFTSDLYCWLLLSYWHSLRQPGIIEEYGTSAFTNFGVVAVAMSCWIVFKSDWTVRILQLHGLPSRLLLHRWPYDR